MHCRKVRQMQDWHWKTEGRKAVCKAHLGYHESRRSGGVTALGYFDLIPK